MWLLIVGITVTWYFISEHRLASWRNFLPICSNIIQDAAKSKNILCLYFVHKNILCTHFLHKNILCTFKYTLHIKKVKFTICYTKYLLFYTNQIQIIIMYLSNSTINWNIFYTKACVKIATTNGVILETVGNILLRVFGFSFMIIKYSNFGDLLHFCFIYKQHKWSSEVSNN